MTIFSSSRAPAGPQVLQTDGRHCQATPAFRVAGGVAEQQGPDPASGRASAYPSSGASARIIRKDRLGKRQDRRTSDARRQGRRAIARLNEAIHRLNRDQRFPDRPSHFSQKHLDRIVRDRLVAIRLPKRLLPTFWEALVLDRAKYACQYCHRSVAGVWRESKHRRTIGLTLDHLRPRARGGRSYSFRNIRAASWSCNGIKSTLNMKAFRAELLSLARALGSIQAKRRA